MIHFESFIKSIHAAILSANDVLVQKNLDLLTNFFEETHGGGDFQNSLDEALQATRDVVEREGNANQEALDKALEALDEVRRNLSQKDTDGNESDRARIPDGLRPIMATIQYPQQTAKGVVMCDVHVPLITIVPLSMTQISEVKLRADLEIQVGEEELFVSFPLPKPDSSEAEDVESRGPSRSVASVEITLTPHHGTEGLKKVVEGFEKMLRAQIPS